MASGKRDPRTHVVLNNILVQINNSHLGKDMVLIGAFALSKQLERFNLYSQVREITLDIDFDINNNVVRTAKDREMYLEQLKQVIVQTPGYQFANVRTRITKTGGLQIKFSATDIQTGIEYDGLGVDADIKKLQPDELHTRIQQPTRAFATKIMLESKSASASRAKDLVDIYKMLTTFYSQGLKKRDVLQLLAYYNYDISNAKVWGKEETFANHVVAVSKIELGPNLTPEHVVQTVRNFLLGLVSENIMLDGVFYNGLWY